MDYLVAEAKAFHRGDVGRQNSLQVRDKGRFATTIDTGDRDERGDGMGSIVECVHGSPCLLCSDLQGRLSARPAIGRLQIYFKAQL